MKKGEFRSYAVPVPALQDPIRVETNEVLFPATIAVFQIALRLRRERWMDSPESHHLRQRHSELVISLMRFSGMSWIFCSGMDIDLYGPGETPGCRHNLPRLLTFHTQRYNEAVTSRIWLRTLLVIAGLSLPPEVPSAAAQSPSVTDPSQQSPNVPGDRDISLKKLPENILADQKNTWLFPVKLAHGEHWWPTLGVLGVTTGFIASDAHSAPPFRNTDNFHDFNQVFSDSHSAALIVAVPAAVYAVGWLRKDSYAQDSALLAGQAFADSFLLNLPFKAISARRQPLSYGGNGPYADSFFNGSHNPFHSGGFYSGHAVEAMAVATVLAHRYRRHRWVPFVAYGLAGAISFSRVTTSNHFAGDAFFGGALGFVIARYVVLPRP